ncbi:tannase/feruloyl esterase family alpha/beta hydrolase [Streptomyces sp. NPDC051985]|uniref:tannase/feruloyl esterase family alpha/beta hydrolase n=1 Tax=Streptomyces sp. NPDC051985 TaxID=3155807 RepID=UPI00342FF123
MKIAQTGWARWVDLDDVPVSESVVDRCTTDALQEALKRLSGVGPEGVGLDGVKVVSSRVNRTGEFRPPAVVSLGSTATEPPPFTGLPDFCEVLLRHRTPGDHVVETFVWVPLRWNGRFLGTVGAGSRTLQWHDLEYIRNLTMPNALRNGFATAATDGGNRDARPFDWPLRPDTGELDRELVRNWAYRGTHEMTVIAKAVIEALYGRPPEFSYLAGCSGGGRQVLAHTQRYPDDYDGYWAADPAVDWARTIPAGLWPALVMNVLGNPLPPAKLEAFRVAAVEACDGVDGLPDGFIGAFDPCAFDPAKAVGEPTGAGPITEDDAEVMRRIWAGPRRSDGSALWHGLRPGTRSWGDNGLCGTAEVDGVLTPMPFWLATAHFRWVLEDPDFDWRTLTFERYEELFDQGVRDLAEFVAEDPDLTGLHHRGAKLIISQAVDDEILPYPGIVDYFRQAVATTGGEERTASFARLFLSDGDRHSFSTGLGPGLTIGGVLAALMRWVEHGEAPDRLVAERHDPTTGAVLATRPVYPYPEVTRYSGAGEPTEAASYTRSGPDPLPSRSQQGWPRRQTAARRDPGKPGGER